MLETQDISIVDAEAYAQNKKDIVEAQLDCDATPGGQRYLRTRIIQRGEENRVYAERLSNGIKLRKMQLESIKSQDKGDMFNHEVKFPFHTTEPFPDSPDDVRQGWTHGRSAPELAEYDRASDNAAATLSADEQSGIWWITNDGGPYLNEHLARKSKVGEEWTFPERNPNAYQQYSKNFVQEKVKALNSAFRKHKLEEPANLYRGLNKWSLPEEVNDYKIPKEDRQEKALKYLHERYPVGERVKINEYMSTTADPGCSKRFTTGDTPIVLEVKARSAIPVGRISSWKNREREYVVDKGKQYEVEGIYENVPYSTPGRKSDTWKESNVTVVRLIEIDE